MEETLLHLQYIRHNTTSRNCLEHVLRIHDCQFDDPYDMQPRMTFDTFTPDLPNLLVVRTEKTKSIEIFILLVLHVNSRFFHVLLATAQWSVAGPEK